MSTPVIIEVAVNGITRKDRNPAAPETPEEIAADTLACMAAGASIVHTHPSRPLGERRSPAETAEDYAAAYRLVLAERPDAILYPTMSGGGSVEDRYDHHRFLAAEGLIRGGCLDPGSANLASFGPDGTPSRSAFVYSNSPNDIHYMMSTCRELGLGPSMAIYEPGFLRMVLGYHRAGLLPAGAMVKFYFSGENGYFGTGYPTFSAPAIPEALALYRAMLGDSGLTWGVTVLGGNVLDSPVARLAVEAGGHLRVGLEDDPTAPGNLELVRAAVDLVESCGRRPATCAEAAEILGL